MALGPRLDLRQSQQLVMTPQLQQAIKLLTLTNLAGTRLAGRVQVPERNVPGKMEFYELILPVTLPPDQKFHDLYFVIKNENNPSKPVMAVDWLRFNL